MAERRCRDELVYTQSEDGLLLEGAVVRPETGALKPTAVVWVHGLTGRFYGPMIVRVGRELAANGYQFVTGNNRGHDFGTVLWTRAGKARFAGGGWERFDESPRDVGAWVEFAMGLGARRVVLIGHSLGALKATYYLAERDDPRVVGLVLASPAVRAGRLRPDLIEQSERMVGEGRGQDLLPWGISPVSGSLSAQTYLNRRQTNLDLFGLDTPEPSVGRVRCPIYAFLGTRERWVGTEADLDLIRRHATGSPRVDTRMFEDADHRYSGMEAEVAKAIAIWLDTLDVA